MIHPNNENGTRPTPEEQNADSKRASNGNPLADWLERELELLEKKYESFVTVNSHRQHFGR